ncbi:HU family DNA-binding protein [bacterium]|nr:HU family DNA-binding protein [bacterium]
MTRDELISGIADQCKCSKKLATEIVNAFLDQILNALAEGKKVSFVGFGSFEVKERQERKGINPQTKEQITIPARKVPVFKAGKKLKDAVK